MSREASRGRGADLCTKLGQPAAEQVPGFTDFLDEVVYGGVWARPGLALQERMICALAALSALERTRELEPMIGAALDAGLAPRSILEIFLQAGLYAGFGTAAAAGACAQAVFAARGCTVAAEAADTDTLETLDRRGRELMAQLHGERSQSGYAEPGDDITGALYPSAVRYGYGVLWFRPGLGHRQRMLGALATFTVLGLEGQLAKFAPSARNVGLTQQEIVEAVIQTAPYGGFPRALNGLAILSKVLREPGRTRE
jgi:alkylhydroperoxidase/carboxymuconolactone decarboxylase family protein YurZ